MDAKNRKNACVGSGRFDEELLSSPHSSSRREKPQETASLQSRLRDFVPLACTIFKLDIHMSHKKCYDI